MPALAESPLAPPLSRVAGPAEWERGELVELMEAIAPGTEPRRRPHRKLWEFAAGVEALERGGALHDGAVGLSTGAGHEPVLYYLANRCRWLIATDIYGEGDFVRGEAGIQMLVDPDLFAPYAYRRRRLSACHMNALDLHFDDGELDFVVSFGSIEHFGGPDAALRALRETARVLRPGGVALITTEMVLDGARDTALPGLHLFSPETLRRLVSETDGLDWLGDCDFDVPAGLEECPAIELAGELGGLSIGAQSYPHLRLMVDAADGRRHFGSVCMALRRAG